MSPAEDSYEAAMRAADALFAAPVSRPVPIRERQPDTVQPGVGFDTVQPTPGDEPAPPKGGRILRVIDEAPPPQYAALEVEHAPKRRGRKPGSKNKPKVPALVAEPIAAHARLAEKADAPARLDEAAVADRAFDEQDFDTRAFDDQPFPADAADEISPAADAAGESPQARTVPAARQVAALQTPAAPRGDKRSWGRDRPRPGEEWKRRRLPRVCW